MRTTFSENWDHLKKTPTIKSMDSKMIKFINEYGYTISQTYNDDDSHLFGFVEDEVLPHDNKNYTWTCFYSSAFLNELYGFNDKDIVLRTDSEMNKLTGEDLPILTNDVFLEKFIEEFVPETGFHFCIEDHYFHIFYFGKNHIYLADYFQEFGRPYFSFQLVRKRKVIKFVKGLLEGDVVVKQNFLRERIPSYDQYTKKTGQILIDSIQIHPLTTRPTMKDVLTIIEKSFNLEKMIEQFEESFQGDLIVEDKMKVYNYHLDFIRENSYEDRMKIFHFHSNFIKENV